MDYATGLIAESLKEYAPFADLQLTYMRDYEVLDNGIHIATYDDGTRIVGNYSDTAQDYEGQKLLPYAYIRVKK